MVGRRGRPADGFHRTTVDVGCEVKNLDFKPTGDGDKQ
jgi:hypothetical protein